MPPKFKAPKFVKYDGTGDPCAHLRMFCRKMALVDTVFCPPSI